MFSSFTMAVLSDILAKCIKNLSVAPRCFKRLHECKLCLRLCIPPKSRDHVKVFVLFRPAVQELQDAKVLVTLMGGFCASTFWMLSRQPIKGFFISFYSPKDGLFVLCYAVLFTSNCFRYCLENEQNISVFWHNI